MKNKENCIQSKIDQIIININPKNADNNNSQEGLDEVRALISYNICLDLYEFLENYSKIQKSELLFQIAVINDMLGNNLQSFEYVDESLKLIPNVPTIILYKSGLYASMDKLEDAQKCLLKYKYLIGEDNYDNYVYNTIRIIYFYLLEYEENIILREINMAEIKYPKFYYNNVILFYIKSKIFEKLSEKFKKIDKNLSYLYQKDSIKNKEKVFNSKKLDADYLYKKDISKDNVTKLLVMIYPNFMDYKPKPLINYNLNFHSGFGLFTILIKLCKIFKLKILIKNYKKVNKKFSTKNSITYTNIDILNEIKELSQNEKIYTDNSYKSNIKLKKCQESILNLSESVWLKNFINTNDNKYINLFINSSKKNIKEIEHKIKKNYYIYNGYYSGSNLKKDIIKNINYNNEYKKKILGKDSSLNELDEDFILNIKGNKSNDDIKVEDSFTVENEINFFNNKLIKNKEKKSDKKIKLINSTQNNHNIKIDKISNKEKIQKINIIQKKNNNSKEDKKNLDNKKQKERKTNNLDEIKSNKIYLNIKKISNRNKNYHSSYKLFCNSNNIYHYNKKNKNKDNIKNIFRYNKDNKEIYTILNYTGTSKNKKKKGSDNSYKLNDNKKYFIKSTKNANSVNNIFNNIIIFGTNNLCISRNNTKLYTNNNRLITSENKNTNYYIKEKGLTLVNELEKKYHLNNEINNNNKEKTHNFNEKNKDNNRLVINKVNNINNNNINYDMHTDKNANKNIIRIQKTENIKDIGKFFIRKIEKEYTKNKNKKKNNEKINQTERIDNKIKNQDKASSSKSINTDKKLKKKITTKNIVRPFLKKINKKDFIIERSSYNTIIIKEYAKRKHNNSKKRFNYLNYRNIAKKRITNSLKKYLGLTSLKKNPKSENNKKSRLLIRDKNNFLAINLDLKSKSKVVTPKYKKITLFGSFKSDSYEKKKEISNKISLPKLNINSPNYMIRLRRKLKNNISKINYNGPKSSFNKFMNINSSLKKSIYYFNNIMGLSEAYKNKNGSLYKVKYNSSNRSNNKNNNMLTII